MKTSGEREERGKEKREGFHLHCIYPFLTLLYICTYMSAVQSKFKIFRGSKTCSA